MQKRQSTSQINPYLIYFFASLFFFYEFVQMTMFNAIGTQVMSSLSINATQLGEIAAVYFVGDLLFLVPAGIALDRYSTKLLIIIAMSLSVFGTLFFSVANNFTAILIYRFLSGIGGSFAFLSCIRITAKHFPPNKMSFLIGIIITIAFLGGVVAQTPFTLLTDLVGWRYSLQILSLLGIGIIGLNVFFNKESLINSSIEVSKNISNSGLAGMVKAIKLSTINAQTWYGAFYICLMNLPIPVLGSIWGSFYLTQACHLTHLESSYVNSMLFFGIIIGSPLSGWCSDYYQNRKLPMLIGAVLAFLVALLFFFPTTLSFPVLLGGFFALGLFSSTQSIGYPTIVGNNLPEAAATASSLASIVIMGGAAFFKWIYGVILDAHWDGLKVNNVSIHSMHAFTHAMEMLPLGFAACILIALGIKDPLAHHNKNL